MKIKYENEILDQKVRVSLIQEIEGSENLRRKDESYRRYLCYKDQTIYYVIQNLVKQFDEHTVREMRYSIANISIVRKVVDKLSRVYSSGVKREITKNQDATKAVQKLEKLLDLNSKMKTANRYLKLQRNMALYLKPCPVYSPDGSEEKWTLVPEILQPHNYDVVEDCYNKTRPLCFILSDYRPRIVDYSSIDPGVRPQNTTVLPKGDGIDQKIADTPEDQGRGLEKHYIFWSKGYHFTCNEKGEIVPDAGNPENINPFGTNMIIDYGIDRDNSFWAQGGNDLIDGAILINGMISHNNNVGVVQGYGQMYMSGTNLPKSVKVGPTHVIQLEYNKDEQAEPKIGFLSANPQLADLRGLVEAYVALLLTTNNLSTSGVSAQLAGGKDFASGISLVIDKAESLEDVSDQQQIFIDKEPCIFEAVKAFLDKYRESLVDELREISLPEKLKEVLTIMFQDPEPIQSESEKLTNYKTRLEIGLDTLITVLMREQPGLTEEQAKSKLMKQIGDEIEIQMLRRSAMSENGPEGNQNTEDENESEVEDDPEVEPSPEDENEPEVE